MRPLWKDTLLAVWLGILIPGIILNGIVFRERQLPEAEIVVPAPVSDSIQRILLERSDGTLETIEMDSYLTGVLLAEMPAEFHMDALKAQAVAARTFAWKAHTTGGKHGIGSVCTKSSCCQSYMEEDSFLSCGGTAENLEKVRLAVASTSGYVLLFGEELIEATYFSSSGGSTEAAVEVWGVDYPYLQAVFSPEVTLWDTVVFTKDEFLQRLGVTLSEPSDQWFDSITYTEGGGIATMEIFGEVYTGVELRHLLGLRSTDFQIKSDGETIEIKTRGYGHRVGMSQYGANAMAEDGSTWQQILQHYYPGTKLAPVC